MKESNYVMHVFRAHGKHSVQRLDPLSHGEDPIKILGLFIALYCICV